MSREMIEVVQRACRAWETGDLDVFRELYTADVTADGGGLWLESGAIARGVDAVIRNFAALIGSFEQNELRPEGAIEVGDTLVVPLLWRGLAPGGTNKFVEQRLIGVFKFTGGRIASMTWFEELDGALDALDLPRSAANDMIVLEHQPVARDGT
jgi:ketosteroid isomerase-like protein